MFFRLAAFSLCAFAIVSADAADEKKKDDKASAEKKLLDKLDSNTDGSVSLEEFAFLPNVTKDAKRISNTELAALFKKLDTSKDKKLSAEELTKLDELLAPKSDIQKAFDKLDSTPDGKVTADEFAALPKVMKDAKGMTAAELTTLFGKLDTTKDKKLTAEEFKKVTEQMTAKADPKKKK